MARGAYIFGCAGPKLDPSEARFFREADPLGFILFARNIEDPAQLSALTADLREAVGWNAPILIDQEGGRVARMAAPHWREVPPALDQAMAAGDQAERALYLRSALIAHDLQTVGIDVNCTPLADIAEDATHPVLKNRLYGFAPETVIARARAVHEGQLLMGVSSVLKHIPGYGRANVDGHLDLPRVDVPLDALEAWEFAPFRALNDIPMGMTAHIVVDAIDPENSATLSPAVMRYIREDIGFQGLMMTDDISMGALTGPVAERSIAAVRAGCDVVLHCNGEMAEMADVATSLGPLTGPAADRAGIALASRPSRADFRYVDIAALEAEFTAIQRNAH